MSLFVPVALPPETEALAKPETMLNQNTLDRLAEENEKALVALKKENAQLAIREKNERATENW